MTDAAIGLNLNILLNHPFPGANSFVESGADKSSQTFPRHMNHIRFRAARRLFEVAANAAGEVDGIAVFPDRDAGGPKSLQDDTFELPREILILCFRLPSAGQHATANLAEGKPNRGARQTLFAQENAMLVVDRLEQLAMSGGILRGAEKQITTGTQRVMEKWNDLLLQIQSQIDHYVATGDQIETRKRGVPDETMT